MGKTKGEGKDPMIEKAAKLGKAAAAGDEKTVNKEADELPKDKDGNYIIP